MRTIAAREEVVLGCACAASRGVKPGMSIAHAKALLGGFIVHNWQHDPAADAAALERLAAWAMRYAPLVMPDPDDADGCDATRAMPGLLADISGCERLYGGELNLLAQLRDAVQQLGFEARIASAPTLGCAWAVARFGADDTAVISSDDLRTTLHDLPLRALRLDADIEHACAEIGVSTIGHLLDLPRSSLPSRFGSDVIMRIDQALGHVMEPVTPVRPRALLRVSRQFNGPVKQIQAIELATQELLAELCDQLLHCESGMRHLDLVLERSDCEPHHISLQVSRSSRHAKHLWSLLRPHLERAHLGYGVEAITLTARRVHKIAHMQREHHAISDTTHAASTARELAETIDTLSNRLSSERVLRAALVESHLPEHAVRFIGAMQQPVRRHRARRERAQRIHRHRRPPVLLARPRSVDVTAMSPDGPLMQMRWGGDLLHITHTIGPERVIGPWWKAISASRNRARDYFAVQDERGRWWWIFRRVGTHQWFVHGGWM